MNKKVLLDMYLNKNLGDDLFLRIISNKYPEVKFYVPALCKYEKNIFPENVKIIRKNYIRLINFLDKKIKFKKISSFNFLKKNKDFFVVLGGSMFIENNESKKDLAKRLYKKYFSNYIPYLIIGSNFGPYQNKYFYEIYNNIFSRAEYICFRDNESYSLFRNLNNVNVAPDLVFSYPVNNKKNKNEKQITISVINLKNRKNLMNYEDCYIKKTQEIIRYFCDKKYMVTLMSFCEKEGDKETIQEILDNNHSTRVNSIYYDGNIDECLDIISKSEYIFATRFHSMILGFLYDKKVLPIIYSEKMSNTLSDLDFDGISVEIQDIDKFSIERDIKKIKRLKTSSKNKVIVDSTKQLKGFEKKIYTK